jgi:predicted nucleotidyltransferase
VSFFASLNALAHESGLRFLLIGGHAVNAAGYGRVTADVDLLARAEDREAWTVALTKKGYTTFHQGATFLQLSPPPAFAAWPLDLMFVGNTTFDQMLAASTTVEMEGSPVPIPSRQHLIALKLHALKTGEVERQGRDFQDVVGLLRAGNLAVRSAEVRNLFQRYGTMEWYEKTIAALGR